MTDAGTLRRAAALVRERATQATPGPWYIEREHRNQVDIVTDLDPETGIAIAAGTIQWGACSEEDAPHIAGMHPGVAQALADLLDLIATRHTPHETDSTVVPVVCDHEQVRWPCDHATAALRVARTILGDTP